MISGTNKGVSSSNCEKSIILCVLITDFLGLLILAYQQNYITIQNNFPILNLNHNLFVSLFFSEFRQLYFSGAAQALYTTLDITLIVL